MNDKTINIGFGFLIWVSYDLKIYADLGGCYLPRPKA